MRKALGERKSKIDKYGVAEEVQRWLEEGQTTREIAEALEKRGKLPEGETISAMAVWRWSRRHQEKNNREVENSLGGRVERMIAFLEARLTEEIPDKPISLESQIRGALAVGKLLELRFKLEKEEDPDEKREAFSLGSLLAEIEG